MLRVCHAVLWCSLVGLIAPEATDFAEITNAVMPLDQLIRKVDLLGVYRGEPIEEGKKSVSFRVLLQDYTRTLSDEEANRVQDTIVATLHNDLGVELRQA